MIEKSQLEDLIRKRRTADYQEALSLLDGEDISSCGELEFLKARLLLDLLKIEDREDEAIKLLRSASAKKIGEATYKIGWYHLEGEHGLERNHGKAISMFHDAHDQGEIWGAIRLGQHYYENRNTNSEYVGIAISFFEYLSRQGNSDGTLPLAICYIRGHGVDQDYDKGRRLLFLASEQEGWGSATAAEMLEEFEKLMTNEYWEDYDEL